MIKSFSSKGGILYKSVKVRTGVQDDVDELRSEIRRGWRVARQKMKDGLTVYYLEKKTQLRKKIENCVIE